MNAADLLKELNTLDEHPTLEAKSCAGDQLGKSFFETVCADHGTLASDHGTLAPDHGSLESEISENIQARIALLGARPGNKIRPILLDLCAIRSFSVAELSSILGKRNPRALKADHLKPLIEEKKLEYLYPDMEKHPKQAYCTVKKP